MKINRTQSSKLAKILIISGVILVCIGAYMFIAWQKNLIPFSLFPKTYGPGEQVINMNKTATEKKATEDLKSNPETKLENPQTDTPETPTVDPVQNKQEANVLITNVGIFNNKVSASGFVTNLVEEGGACTYMFTNGSQSIAKESQTLVNPTSTTCKTVSFSADELSSGVWRVYIKYVSAGAEGVSNAKEFNK